MTFVRSFPYPSSPPVHCYRIVAQRGTTKSTPSGTASVYDPGASLSLESGSQIAA